MQVILHQSWVQTLMAFIPDHLLESPPACAWKLTTWSEESESVAQSCPTVCDLVDCSPPGSSVHGILQARILEWVTIPFSKGSSQPRDQTHISCIEYSLPSEPPGKPPLAIKTVVVKWSVAFQVVQNRRELGNKNEKGWRNNRKGEKCKEEKGTGRVGGEKNEGTREAH